MHNERLRAEIAWLLWCANEGYVKAEDRALVDNWFLPGSAATDHPDDDPKAWLGMADEVIAALPSSDVSGSDRG